MKLPEAFTEEMRKLLGAEYSAWEESFQDESFGKESFRGLRVNTRKISPEAFAQRGLFSLRPVPWTKNGFYLEGEERASRHPWYAAGLYYLQEPSAMVPAAALPIEEGDKVLDLCAAPGGKATELAAKLKGTGLLVANDISNSRAKALLKNLELFGAENILVTSESPERLVSYFEGFFDKILIDAPCSGEGMFRKEPSMRADWLEKGPAFYGRLQKEIVSQAAILLRPGGLLLYSTCTFSVQENEETLLTLLRSEPGFRMLPLGLPEISGETGSGLSEEVSGYGFAPGRPDLISLEAVGEGGLTQEEWDGLLLAARLYPHRIDGEGHFAALLQKKGGEEAPERWKRCMSGRKDLDVGKGVSAASRNSWHGGRDGRGRSSESNGIPEGWRAFAKLLKCPPQEDRLRLYDGRLYLLPEELLNRNIRGLRFLRTGLLLGEVKKDRFEPGQALAMSLCKEDFAAVLDFSLEDERVIRYLKGETLDVSDLEETAAAGGKSKSGGKNKARAKDDASGWRLVCAEGFSLGWGKVSQGTLKNKYYPGWRW